jgi:hypothetical protein
VESSVSREGSIHEEVLMNLVHFADLLIMHEIIAELGFCPQT